MANTGQFDDRQFCRQSLTPGSRFGRSDWQETGRPEETRSSAPTGGGDGGELQPPVATAGPAQQADQPPQPRTTPDGQTRPETGSVGL